MKKCNGDLVSAAFAPEVSEVRYQVELRFAES
jgi:hypothetical protein